MSLLTAHQLTVEIAGRRICEGLELVLGRGECWALLGRNGAGKTTLLHTIAGLRRPEHGRTSVGGTPLDQLSRRRIAQCIGLLLQDDEDPFPHSVLETALIGRHPFLRPWQWEHAEDMARARAALRDMELADMEARQVPTLSGGERRRLGIATLLTQDPEVYLLDEPTNHLDPRHQVLVLERLRGKVRSQGKAMLVALHDVNLAARYCDRFILLFGDGATLTGPRELALTSTQLGRLYAHPMDEIDSPHGKVFIPQPPQPARDVL